MIIGDLVLPFWLVPYLLRGYHACFSFTFFATEMVPYIGSLVILATIPWLAPVVFLVLLGWWLKAVPSQILGWSTGGNPNNQAIYLDRGAANASHCRIDDGHC